MFTSEYTRLRWPLTSRHHGRVFWRLFRRRAGMRPADGGSNGRPGQLDADVPDGRRVHASDCGQLARARRAAWWILGGLLALRGADRSGQQRDILHVRNTKEL